MYIPPCPVLHLLRVERVVGQGRPGIGSPFQESLPPKVLGRLDVREVEYLLRWETI